ncbi:MAG: hypothetical protein JOY73_11285, partial [Actinobacteria bacterium]|nr:hypothetical protein [Actinomycetota bacterium]
MDVFNIFSGEPEDLSGDDPEGYRSHSVRVGPKIGASRLGMSIYDLPEGQAVCP